MVLTALLLTGAKAEAAADSVQVELSAAHDKVPHPGTGQAVTKPCRASLVLCGAAAWDICILNDVVLHRSCHLCTPSCEHDVRLALRHVLPTVIRTNKTMPRSDLYVSCTSQADTAVRCISLGVRLLEQLPRLRNLALLDPLHHGRFIEAVSQLREVAGRCIADWPPDADGSDDGGEAGAAPVDTGPLRAENTIGCVAGCSGAVV